MALLMPSYLVINCGTSSIKVSLFDQDGKRKVEGSVKHLFSDSILEVNGQKKQVSSHEGYPEALADLLQGFDLHAHQIKAIGHRVVHGGETYKQSTLIDKTVLNDLKALNELAPLHNPPALSCIEWAQKKFGDIPQIAVFDTAFHSTLPEKAALYPIPFDSAKKFGIKRYGFHGIAHEFSWKTYMAHGGRPTSRVITLHLGSGSSLAAIDAGRSIDTTMGFTPLDGLMMATRSGELDPAIVSYLCHKEGKSPEEIIRQFNEEAGLLGVSGKSADMKQIEELMPHSPRAGLAFDMFVYRVVKHTAALMAVLNGVDALIFSGGIGERSPKVREEVVKAFGWCDLFLDEQKNKSCNKLEPGSFINVGKTKADIVIVGSDENRHICLEMMRLLK